MEGIVKLAPGLPEPEGLLAGLLAVSLVEPHEAPDLLTRESQCSRRRAETKGSTSTPPAPQIRAQTAAPSCAIPGRRHP
jgi:hypothetical protein